MTSIASLRARLTHILLNDSICADALRVVKGLDLPDCWIAAGLVRDAVWNWLHDRPPNSPMGDIDIIWHDPSRSNAAFDRAMEQQLNALRPGLPWSIKNQARMHLRNGDPPYRSASDAMRYWPETATATAVRMTSDGRLDIEAPFGLEDLFAPRLVPTPAFTGNRRPTFDRRVHDKGWLSRYPLLDRG
ncbi:nucleotidyltransferase family protein [Sphingobium sp. CCH11-B1]|jgi:hypothetical protein|uniref:nucleotidyltransferase family protein n=1 Tax=Sphingobium sp. CCH11-B1 TaxID=1768781 RepID=UPI0009E95869|nr:nucleotidyltransferase family protein [Sphingobium sp. CCH11-B1]MEA3389173.1 nucleotidyltransferase family protein [Pseudomonadota bacterium]